MNTEMTLSATALRLNTVMNQAANAVTRPLDNLSSYYSKVLDRRVNNSQTLLLLNAQAAFMATVFPVECPLLLRLGCCVWLLVALKKCKENL